MIQITVKLAARVEQEKKRAVMELKVKQAETKLLQEIQAAPPLSEADWHSYTELKPAVMYFFTRLMSMDRADYGLQGKFYEAASVFDPHCAAELNEEDIESRLKLLSSHPKFKETLIDDLIEQIRWRRPRPTSLWRLIMYPWLGGRSGSGTTARESWTQREWSRAAMT